MPILEAQAVGRPVITSNILSMPEVGGDAAIYVDPTNYKEIEKELPKPRFPIQAYQLLSRSAFQIKLVGLDEKQNQVYKRVFDSDSFGHLNFKIPLNESRQGIAALQVYEVGKEPGLELHLGTYIPLRINNPKKIIVCDFDKTLVDTKYSTTKEVYRSLTKPLEYFPTVTNSVDIIKDYISKET
jgi:hypothetical protein